MPTIIIGLDDYLERVGFDVFRYGHFALIVRHRGGASRSEQAAIDRTSVRKRVGLADGARLCSIA
jgi:hypothetical protein